MRVLHVIPSVGPLRGGPSVMLRTTTRALVRAGVSVDVATTDDNGPDRLDVANSRPVVEEGVTYWYFPRQTRFYTFSWPLTLWLAQNVKNYDLVHIHALFSYAAIPAAFWASYYQIPYIVRPLGVLNVLGMHKRRPWLKKISYHLIEKRIIRGSAVIHYTSEQERIEAAELGIDHSSIIIPNSTEIPSECAKSAPGRFRMMYPQLAERLIILFLSRLDPKKGLDILLPAFAEVRAQYAKATLVIAGSGEPSFVSSLQQQADRMGIAPDVVWSGFLTGEEKWAALAESNIFVLPSYSENFGVAVVEAMACGLPVVVSDQVAIHREVADASAGLVVRCQIKELAEALLKLLQDASLRSTMGSNGRHLARTQFAPRSTTQSLINLYSEICAAGLRQIGHVVS
jgi:glycosyltransferase involved in cell wall biosynthesis